MVMGFFQFLTAGLMASMQMGARKTRACFQYAVDTRQDLWFSTKDTIAKIYDGEFRGDGAVGALPHLGELGVLLHPLAVGGDGGALHRHAVQEGCLMNYYAAGYGRD